VKRGTRVKWRRRILGHGTLIVLGAAYLFPLLWMLSTALKTEGQLYSYSMELIPAPVRWSNFPESLQEIPFFRYLANSLIISGLTIIGTLISCSMAAYALARIPFRGRNAVFAVILATMMMPYQATMLPLYLVYARLGWVGSFLPLVVPAFFGNAFFIFLLRQFFRGIPADLSDSGRVDGCSEFGIFFHLVLPLAKPALAVVVLFTFLWTWNDFIGPLLYLTEEKDYTIALGLQQFVSAYGSRWGLLMACTTVVTLPIIALFFLTQRTFVQGIALTGLKG